MILRQLPLVHQFERKETMRFSPLDRRPQPLPDFHQASTLRQIAELVIAAILHKLLELPLEAERRSRLTSGYFLCMST